MVKLEKYQNYNDKVRDVDEIAGVDMNLKSDFYLHLALQNCINALNDADIKQAMIKYRMGVEALHALAKGIDVLSDDYYNDIAEFKKKNPDKDNNDMKITHKRFELLTREIFSSTVNTQKLKV